MLFGYGMIAVPTGIFTVEMGRASGAADRAAAGRHPRTDEPDPAARTCEACGRAETDPEARFCRYCGAGL